MKVLQAAQEPFLPAPDADDTRMERARSLEPGPPAEFASHRFHERNATMHNRHGRKYHDDGGRDARSAPQCAAVVAVELRRRSREIPSTIPTTTSPSSIPNTAEYTVSASHTTTGPAASIAWVTTCSRS